MNLKLPTSLAKGYKSASQKARVVSEGWVASQLPCPACGGKLDRLPPNTKAADLECRSCKKRYQLKSSSRRFGRKVSGADFRVTLEAVRNARFPSLILLQYERAAMRVVDVRLVHHSWITLSSIEARKPLGLRARRAGWVGCNIVLERIPDIAFIPLVRRGAAVPATTKRGGWKRARSVEQSAAKARGWIADVLAIVDRLPKDFSLADVYAYEKELGRAHKANKNVRAKICQQLQVARRLGALSFVGRGMYRKSSGG